jgi:hypothetical protein
MVSWADGRASTVGVMTEGAVLGATMVVLAVLMDAKAKEERKAAISAR